MSGNPGFQATAFQGNAFQSGVALVAANYSLGSPIFATPLITLKLVFSATAYALGSPAFATPTLATATSIRHLNANPYSLASPSFAIPSLRTNYTTHANAFSLGPLSYGIAGITIPAVKQNHRLFSNVYWLTAALDFAKPSANQRCHLSTLSYALGSPAFAAPPPPRETKVVAVDAYWLQSPSFNFPRLQFELVDVGFPPTYFSQAEDAANMLEGLMNYIIKSVPPGISDATNTLRRLASTLRDHAEEAVRGDTLGTDLAQIYLAADVAGATYAGIEATRQYLMSQIANKSVLTQAIFRSALIMTLALQSKIVGRIAFQTQTQVQNMLIHMRDAFDAAKAIGIDEIDVLVYQAITAMGGAVMNHLATTELQLPRLMAYRTPMPMPSLYLANRIYADASRSDEIEAENGVVNPAFCPMNLRVLSIAQFGT